MARRHGSRRRLRRRAGRARARAQARSRSRRRFPPRSPAITSRQNRPAEAVAAAEQALKLDKDNVEAHNMLGTVYSAWADGGGAAAAGADARPSTRDAGDRASHRHSEHAADGDQSEPADDARPPAAARRQGRSRGADSREGRGAGAVGRRAAAAAVRSADLAGQDRRSRSRRSSQAARDQSALFAQLGQFYERQGKWEEAAAAYDEAIGGSQQPSRDLQIRYAAALINTDGGAAQGAQRARRAAEGQPERHARAVHAVDRRANRRRRQGGGSDRAQDLVDRSDQRRRPPRARRRCCSIDSTTSRSPRW